MIDGGTLSDLLDREASLALHGADDAKPEGEPKDGEQGEKKDGKSTEPEPKKDDDKARTLSEDEWRQWSNFTEERDRIHNEKRTAESERDAAIKERDDLKATGATDADAKKQLTTITSERDALRASNEDLQLQLAFLRAPGYDWVDADAALKLANLESVDRDKKGKVIDTSLKVELDRLAKEKPYLLKPKKADDEDKNDDKGPKKTGDAAPQGRQTNNDKDKQARESSLRAKYPALRR